MPQNTYNPTLNLAVARFNEVAGDDFRPRRTKERPSRDPQAQAIIDGLDAIKETQANLCRVIGMHRSTLAAHLNSGEPMSEYVSSRLNTGLQCLREAHENLPDLHLRGTKSFRSDIVHAITARGLQVLSIAKHAGVDNETVDAVIRGSATYKEIEMVEHALIDLYIAAGGKDAQDPR